MTLHPATLLLSWGGFALLLQSLVMAHLAWAAALLLPLPLLLARRRAWLLLRRARWLLLSIAVLFSLAVPGERLPGALGDLGVTYDGLTMAAEHVLRLVLLLASLALLHEHLGTDGLVAGIHWVLAPLADWRALRERIVVRLMLVLEYVESDAAPGWQAWMSGATPGPERLPLATVGARAVDWALLVLLGVGLAIWLLA